MAATEAELEITGFQDRTKNLGKHAKSPSDPNLRLQVIALSKEGLKPAQIAKQTGANLTTIYYWLNAEADAEPLVKSLDLAQRFEKAAELFVGLAVKKARKANFRDLMTAAGIAVDKSQLLSGLPTSISGNVMSDDERRLRLAELLAKIEARAKSDPD